PCRELRPSSECFPSCSSVSGCPSLWMCRRRAARASPATPRRPPTLKWLDRRSRHKRRFSSSANSPGSEWVEASMHYPALYTERMPEHWGTELLLCLAALAAGIMNSIAGGGTLLTFPALLSVVPPVV